MSWNCRMIISDVRHCGCTRSASTCLFLTNPVWDRASFRVPFCERRNKGFQEFDDLIISPSINSPHNRIGWSFFTFLYWTRQPRKIRLWWGWAVLSPHYSFHPSPGEYAYYQFDDPVVEHQLSQNSLPKAEQRKEDGDRTLKKCLYPFCEPSVCPVLIPEWSTDPCTVGRSHSDGATKPQSRKQSALRVSWGTRWGKLRMLEENIQFNIAGKNNIFRPDFDVVMKHEYYWVHRLQYEGKRKIHTIGTHMVSSCRKNTNRVQSNLTEVIWPGLVSLWKLNLISMRRAREDEWGWKLLC